MSQSENVSLEKTNHQASNEILETSSDTQQVEEMSLPTPSTILSGEDFLEKSWKKLVIAWLKIFQNISQK